MAFINTTDDYIADLKLEQNNTLTDSVSCIEWSSSLQDHFACTMWDGTLKIYQVTKNQTGNSFRVDTGFIKEKASYNVGNSWPLTFCAWSPDNSLIFVGTSKGEVKAFDTNSSNILDIGHHSAPINYLKFLPGFGNTLLTSAY